MPPPAVGDEPEPRVDGRTARAERTRGAIVDAHVALILAGELRPTAEKIVNRAGVSLRALWTHFPELEHLFAASGERILLMQDAVHEPVPTGWPLPARIDAYCRRRAEHLERLAPAARAARLKEPFSGALQALRVRHLDRARAELAELFAGELAGAGDGRDALLTALTAVSMSPTWATLRDDLRLDVGSARAVLHRTVTALLRQPT